MPHLASTLTWRALQTGLCHRTTKWASENLVGALRDAGTTSAPPTAVQRQTASTPSLEQPTPRRLVQFGSLTFAPRPTATGAGRHSDAIAEQALEALAGDITRRDLATRLPASMAWRAFLELMERSCSQDTSRPKSRAASRPIRPCGIRHQARPAEFVRSDGSSRDGDRLPGWRSPGSPVHTDHASTRHGEQKAHTRERTWAPAGTWPDRRRRCGDLGWQGGYGNYVVIRTSRPAATAKCPSGRTSSGADSAVSKARLSARWVRTGNGHGGQTCTRCCR